MGMTGVTYGRRCYVWATGRAIHTDDGATYGGRALRTDDVATYGRKDGRYIRSMVLRTGMTELRTDDGATYGQWCGRRSYVWTK